MNTNLTCAIAGAKGGVGKTTTSINLGASLAAAGYATVTVELDLAMANLVDFLEVDIDVAEATTLHDVLAGESDVEAATYETNSGLSVVPSGTDLQGYAETDLRRLPDVVETLRWHYDVVLLDTPAGLSEETVRPLQVADETILVSTPRVASVRNVQNTKELAERVECDVRGLVLTKSGTGASPGAERVAEFLEVELLGHVPEDEAVPHSQDRGRPVVTNAPNSGAAIAYRKVAKQLVSADHDGSDQRAAPTASETAPSDEPGLRDERPAGASGRTRRREPTDGGQVPERHRNANDETAASMEPDATQRARDAADSGARADAAETDESRDDRTRGTGSERERAGSEGQTDGDESAEPDEAQSDADESAEPEHAEGEEETGEPADRGASAELDEVQAADEEPDEGERVASPEAESESAEGAVSSAAGQSASDGTESDRGSGQDAGADAESDQDQTTTDTDQGETTADSEQDQTTADTDESADSTGRDAREGEQAPGADGDAGQTERPEQEAPSESDGDADERSGSDAEREEQSVASRVLSLFSF